MSSPLLGRCIVASLIAEGVEHVVLCPGSRSTSIAVALADREDIAVHRRIDERSAAFTALGLAKASGVAAIVVTSGTAVGNLLPAVMEAHHSGVALIVITADRPATLIGVGANQATNQSGIFGSFLRADQQLTSTDANPEAWCQQTARMVVSARGTRSNNPGPVHINVALTEPFVDETPDWPTPTPLHISAAASRSHRIDAGRSVVLVGDASPDLGRAAREFAETAGLPLFAEPSSNARSGPNAISNYRAQLPDHASDIKRVIVYGHPTLSRPVTALLRQTPVTVVGPDASWPDPGWSVDSVFENVAADPVDPSWLSQWKQRDAPPLRVTNPITGPDLAAAVISHSHGNVMFGASNPIRDADLAPIIDQDCSYWANRGLAGIDGTIATATGIALATERPMTVLLGDLSFLHDIGSLQVPRGQTLPDMRIVVADDCGGSIFSSLEIGESPHLERFFTMPHDVDLVMVASGFGVNARRISESAALAEALAEPISAVEVLVVLVQRR